MRGQDRVFRTREIKYDKEEGAWFFICRKCKTVGLPHYHQHEAFVERADHKCNTNA